MSSKKPIQTVTNILRIRVPAGKATSSPPIGPALGQRGINIGEFCRQFNNRTKHIKPGIPLPVLITTHPDRSFTFIHKLPSISYFLKNACELEKGAQQPGKHIVGQLTLRHIYEIARVKQQDVSFQHLQLSQICACILGSARSMGIQVVIN